ncbi:hypothetical protein BGZ79_002982 [Entomortierella chlamydospora]|nr:hypothetical protein BGZ79_002982 [Entomortierella chlamydospora]
MSHSSSSTKGNPDNNGRPPPQNVAGAEATFTQVPDSSIPSRDESSSTPPANPPSPAVSPSNPISLAPSKGELDEPDMTPVDTNDNRAPYHRLKYLRTCYSTQSIMCYCNSYGLFNEPGTLPMVPNVEDETCVLRFSDMAIKVDRTIRELEHNAPYPEARGLKLNTATSKDELDMALIGTHNTKALCRRLEYLRTSFAIQSVMYHCRSYGLFSEPEVFLMVPNVEDEMCAERFGDMAVKVDGVIRGLKRIGSFLEATIESDRAHRADIGMERWDDEYQDSKRVRRDTAPPPKEADSSSSGPSATIPNKRPLSSSPSPSDPVNSSA